MSLKTIYYYLILTAFVITSNQLLAADTNAQRAAFQAAMKLASQGKPEALVHEQKLLRNYVLQPDIEAAYLKSSLKRQPNKAIKRFLETYPDYASSNQLLRAWLDHLYKTKQWKTYLDSFPTTNLADTSAGRQCEHIISRLRSGIKVNLTNEAIPLWMIGKSQTKKCDTLFDHLNRKGYITKERLLKRIDLSLERANFDIATYLAKSLVAKDQKVINPYIAQWRRMSINPSRELSKAIRWRDKDRNRQIVAYGIKKQARLNIEKAIPLWKNLSRSFNFNTATRDEINNYVALRAAYQRHPQTSQQYAITTPTSLSLRENEWQIRNALWNQDWQGVLDAISILSPESQKSSQWSYWKARALEQTGNRATAQDQYRSIADKKNYFGFLASDRLQQNYQFNNPTNLPNEASIKKLSSQVDFRRARELQAVKKFGWSRSEWRTAVKKLSNNEKIQAAILAFRWNLPTNGIRSAVNSSASKDLELMYPISFENHVNKYAHQKSLEPAWVMGLIRQESLFMQDVKSSANAYGLMQLLPATAKQTAKRHKFSYRGYSHLVSPSHNIRLGTSYLSQIQRQLQANPVLATAGYNGGPHRVKKWLPKKTLPADIWIENIVFNETRNYVQKVMANKVIYSWRMYNKPIRLSDVLPDVHPRA